VSVQEIISELPKLTELERQEIAAQISNLNAKRSESKRAGSPLKFKTFDLGAKGPLPSRSEIADEMFNRE
jgi:hypothetical protein